MKNEIATQRVSRRTAFSLMGAAAALGLAIPATLLTASTPRRKPSGWTVVRIDGPAVEIAVMPVGLDARTAVTSGAAPPLLQHRNRDRSVCSSGPSSPDGQQTTPLSFPSDRWPSGFGTSPRHDPQRFSCFGRADELIPTTTMSAARSCARSGRVAKWRHALTLAHFANRG